MNKTTLQFWPNYSEKDKNLREWQCSETRDLFKQAAKEEFNADLKYWINRLIEKTSNMTTRIIRLIGL